MFLIPGLFLALLHCLSVRVFSGGVVLYLFTFTYTVACYRFGSWSRLSILLFFTILKFGIHVQTVKMISNFTLQDCTVSSSSNAHHCSKKPWRPSFHSVPSIVTLTSLVFTTLWQFVSKKSVVHCHPPFAAK